MISSVTNTTTSNPHRRNPCPIVVPVQPVYSIAQFCCQNGISRSLFYNLLRDGHGPRVMKVGRRTLISHEAAEAWRRSMETATETRVAA